MPRSHPPGRPAADDSTLELAELLSHSARRLWRGAHTQLAPLGVTYAQARVLRVLASAGRPLRMADIATQMDVVPRSATTMVDAVEHAGLVARRIDPDDRRSVLVELTGAGHALLARLDRARQTTADEVLGSLSRAQRHELHQLLEQLCQSGGCSRCCPPTRMSQAIEGGASS